MKRNKILWLIFICVLFFFGCTREYVCNEPYVDKNGHCCLDLDKDGLCDSANSLDEPYQADSESYDIIHEPRILTQDTLDGKWREIEAEDRYEFFLKRGESEREALEEKYERKKETSKRDC